MYWSVRVFLRYILWYCTLPRQVNTISFIWEVPASNLGPETGYPN
jgi:hypothetical protein